MTGSNLNDVFSEASTDVPRKRGRWIVPLLVVLVLLVAAFAVAEWIGRMLLGSAVNAGISQAGIDLSETADVEVPGLLLPQVITGSVAEVTIRAKGAELEGIRADVDITAEGVSVLGRTADALTLTASADADAVEAVLRSAGDSTALASLGDAIEISIAEPNITVQGALSVFGQSIPLALDAAPSAADAALQLAPQAIRMGETEVSLVAGDSLPQGAPSFLSSPIPVCVASSLPAGAVLTDAAVEGERLLLTFDVDGEILMKPSLRARGVC